MRVRLLKSVKDGTGWHKPGAVMDFKDEEAACLIKKKAAVSLEQSEEKVDDEVMEDLLLINGVNETRAEALIEGGYTSIQMIAEAQQSELVKVQGIGERTADKIIESAQELIDLEEEED